MGGLVAADVQLLDLILVRVVLVIPMLSSCGLRLGSVFDLSLNLYFEGIHTHRQTSGTVKNYLSFGNFRFHKKSGSFLWDTSFSVYSTHCTTACYLSVKA